MTEIKYALKENEFSVVCMGHAGFADMGHDIVCAGISTLIQTLTAHVPEVSTRYDFHIESGKVWCYAYGRDAVISFKTILTGLEILEDMYPQYISIIKGCPLIKKNPLP